MAACPISPPRPKGSRHPVQRWDAGHPPPGLLALSSQGKFKHSPGQEPNITPSLPSGPRWLRGGSRQPWGARRPRLKGRWPGHGVGGPEQRGHHPPRAFSLPTAPGLDAQQEALSLQTRPGAMGCPHMGGRGVATHGGRGVVTHGGHGVPTHGGCGVPTRAGLAPWTQEENCKPPAPPGSCPAPGFEEQEADFLISPNPSRGTLAAQDAEAPQGRMGQREARQVSPGALR